MDANINAFKTRFNEEFSKLVRLKGANAGFMNSKQYKTIIESVKVAKNTKSKTPKQHRRVKRYDIYSADGVEKLITSGSNKEMEFKFFVPNEEMFDIIHETHLSMAHCGRNKMLQEISRTYKNITHEVVTIYLKLCVQCQLKYNKKEKSARIQQSEMNKRCQVDLIDMQSNPDGPYKFILLYQDCLTKFIQLRPLNSKRALEVATTLLDIFCMFGAPMIICSNSGREFCSNILSHMSFMWPALKLVTGEPHGSDTKCTQHVEEILTNWLKDNNSNNWSSGLKFVQMMKNRAYCDEINNSPYKAMFGKEFKTGLSGAKLPQELVQRINTEEKLLDALKETSFKEQNFDTFSHEEDNFSENADEQLHLKLIKTENSPDILENLETTNELYSSVNDDSEGKRKRH